jgi:plasmid stabilization system protein ParE
MSGFVFHPEAYADLEEIWDYIAADNPVAADRFLGEIEEKIQTLVRFPAQGHARPDLTSRPLRFCLLREYLIVYAPDQVRFL